MSGERVGEGERGERGERGMSEEKVALAYKRRLRPDPHLSLC